jgi:transcriptional regulator with XRE-family HTH domain
VLQAHNFGIVNEPTEGERIALRRNRLGWKQGVLAERAKVSLNTVVSIEKDRGVRTESLRAVLAALDAAEAKPTRRGDLVRHSGEYQSSASMKEGADVPASARLADIRKRLANIQGRQGWLCKSLGARARKPRSVLAASGTSQAAVPVFSPGLHTGAFVFMGLSKLQKRRKRRQYRSGARPRHRLTAGRTGSVRHKQRRGMLTELARRS